MRNGSGMGGGRPRRGAELLWKMILLALGRACCRGHPLQKALPGPPEPLFWNRQVGIFSRGRSWQDKGTAIFDCRTLSIGVDGKRSVRWVKNRHSERPTRFCDCSIYSWRKNKRCFAGLELPSSSLLCILGLREEFRPCLIELTFRT